MQKTMFLAKIHRAVITHADPAYEGSVSVDEVLLEAAGISEYEAVHVWNITRGTRLMTYAIKAPRDSGFICINGAAAHLNEPGDTVILATFGQMDAEEAHEHKPVVVRVDANNRIIGRQSERPGPALPKALH
ncbi:MAG: aspartate 1-decarboxylase [Myxococcales bacterium]|nr:aspartate 1-decarboxylase [Myxococcales bacterium]